MVRNSIQFVVWKDDKAVTSDLKRIYLSVTEEEARSEPKTLRKHWMKNTHKSSIMLRSYNILRLKSDNLVLPDALSMLYS